MRKALARRPQVKLTRFIHKLHPMAHAVWSAKQLPVFPVFLGKRFPTAPAKTIFPPMEFGKVADLQGIDFRLPADHPSVARILAPMAGG